MRRFIVKQTRTVSVESTQQGSDVIRRISEFAEATVWTPRMLAALGNGVKGGKWFRLIDKVYRLETLKAAWRKVRANKGASGVDKISVSRFERDSERNLFKLSESLRTGKYRASGVRRVEIDKGGGKTRPLGIPTVKDRIVQMAVKMVLEPIFEARFLECSYGFRPCRWAGGALDEVERLLKEGKVYVVDADLAGFFDSIPHEQLLERVKEEIADGRVISLIEQWLKQEIITEASSWNPIRGTPQGAIISPLLANIYLHGLDERMKSGGFSLVRYADDFVVLCKTESESRLAYEEIQKWVSEHGLSLNAEKTHLGDCRKPGNGFEFLGYYFESRRREIRKKSLTRVKDRIRSLTRRRCNGKSLDEIVRKLNSMLRGWYNYFKRVSNRYIFKELDWMIRRRIRALLHNRTGKKGNGRGRTAKTKWNMAFFNKIGLYELYVT